MPRGGKRPGAGRPRKNGPRGIKPVAKPPEIKREFKEIKTGSGNQTGVASTDVGAVTARVGRPTSYQPEFAERARELCLRGATDFELAEEFGVTTVTIWRWQSAHQEFCNALREGKDAFDDRVERSLAMRAIGYSYHVEKLVQRQGVTVRETVVEHVPPDPGAAKQWLTNRRPEMWRDTRSSELSGPNGGPIPIEATEMDDITAARKVAFALNLALRRSQTLVGSCSEEEEKS